MIQKLINLKQKWKENNNKNPPKNEKKKFE